MRKPRKSPVETLTRAHDALLKDLQQLEKETGAPSGPNAAKMSTRLDQVRTHITQHFRFEEQDGYMDAVVQRAPHQERTIEQLREEHRQLANSLEALREEALATQSLDDPFREKVRAWVAQVRDHGTRENRLIQEAFNLDIGAED
jgi:hemerythrin-like domain-containing protein